MANKRQDIGPCPVCGRAMSKFTTHIELEIAIKVCRDCENKLRTIYPLSYGKKTKKSTKDRRLDPLEKLTLEEFKEALKTAGEKLEDLREKYGYNALYKVEDISMEPGIWFGPAVIKAEGRTVYGFFDVKDKVDIIRRGVTVASAAILDIKRVTAGEKDAVDWENRAEGGYPCKYISFCQKDLIIAPGDYIVKSRT